MWRQQRFQPADCKCHQVCIVQSALSDLLPAPRTKLVPTCVPSHRLLCVNIMHKLMVTDMLCIMIYISRDLSRHWECLYRWCVQSSCHWSYVASVECYWVVRPVCHLLTAILHVMCIHVHVHSYCVPVDCFQFVIQICTLLWCECVWLVNVSNS